MLLLLVAAAAAAAAASAAAAACSPSSSLLGALAAPACVEIGATAPNLSSGGSVEPANAAVTRSMSSLRASAEMVLCGRGVPAAPVDCGWLPFVDECAWCCCWSSCCCCCFWSMRPFGEVESSMDFVSTRTILFLLEANGKPTRQQTQSATPSAVSGRRRQRNGRGDLGVASGWLAAAAAATRAARRWRCRELASRASEFCGSSPACHPIRPASSCSASWRRRQGLGGDDDDGAGGWVASMRGLRDEPRFPSGGRRLVPLCGVALIVWGSARRRGGS
jgi:hypothetical protein